MIAVIDSSAFIDLWRGRRNMLERVTAGIVPLAAHAELLVGLRLAADPEAERRRMENTCHLIGARVQAPGDATAAHFADLQIALRAQGRKIPHNDIWIAAAALEHELPLLTSDLHFRGLPELRLVDEAG